MKIGFDAKRAFHNFRGLGNYSRTLLAGLSEYYPEEKYCLFTTPYQDPRSQQWVESFPNFEVVTPSGVMGCVPSLWRSLFLAGEVKKYHVDIFHGLSHEIPPGIEKLGIKTVVTIHDLIFLRRPDFFPWIDRLVYLQKFKSACQRADLILAITEQTKKDIIYFFDIPEEKIKVCYQSISPRFYQSLPISNLEEVCRRYSLNRPYILSVGAIEERKNALGLVKAFEKIKNDFSGDLVLVGGRSAYTERVEHFITEAKLSARVKMISDVLNDDLPALYQRAELFCYPSFFEGFGLPIVEALFSETPVITSQGSCFPEAGGEHSLYVDPNHTDELAEAIRQVLGNVSLAREMVCQGRKFAEKFHVKSTTSSLIGIYYDLLNK